MSGIQLEMQTGTRSKSLIYGRADDCVISRFNTRKTRNEDDITRLAQRIERNGFEVTRALWVYEDGDGKYEVFAGGNRLEAVRKTSHEDNVPLILHEGYTDEEIAQLEMQDNENDEYHVKVSVVDVWAEYARLRGEEGWTQKQIARAKGVTQKTVSLRLKLHDKTPDKIKDFIRQDKFTEGHLEHISTLYVDVYFSSWLTIEQLWIDIAKKARFLTTRETKEEVDRWKEIIQTVKDYYAALPETDVIREYKEEDGKEICIETEYNPKEDFVNRLAEKDPDTKRKVQNIINQVKKEQLEAIRKYEAFSKRQADEAESERQRQEEEERKRQEREFFYPKIFCQSSEDMDGELSDIDDAIHVIPDESVHLVITSPPYNIGKEYDTHDDSQDWLSYQQTLLKPIFEQCYKKLVVGGRIAVNVPNIACQEGEKPIFILFDIFNLLKSCGFEDREILTWVKSEVGENFQERMDALAFDTTAWGSWKSPSNPIMRSLSEFIIIMHKQSPQLEGDQETDLTEVEFKKWTRNVWFIPPKSSKLHPAVFPEELPRRLIKLYSYPRQVILDPFMGIGTTGIAALKNQRRFIGFDISEQYCRVATKEILNLSFFQDSQLPHPLKG